MDKLNITGLVQEKEKMNGIKPDVVINCATATDVDGCETNEDVAFKVNFLGLINLVMSCESGDFKLIEVLTL